MSFDVAWAAGLFEGEGSICLRNGRPIVQLRGCDEEVVRRFKRVLRLGRVYGPYVNRSSERDGYPRQDFFHWTAPSDESQIAIEMMWPWLSSRRRRRAAEVGFHVECCLESANSNAMWTRRGRHV